MPIPRLASSPLAVSRSPLTIRPGRALHRLALLLSAALAALLTVLAVTPAAWAETNSPLVALYGAAGTFGGLRDAQRTPSGETFAARAVDDWAFLPGQAAYFSAAAPDGTVFIANEPQTDSQYRPTATTMAVSAFNPVTERIRHLVVPTTTGRTTTATGADVADVEAVRAGTTSRVAFMSAVPYQGSGDLGAQGLYPTLGYLSATSAGWSYDGVRSLTADALPAAASACVQRYNALWQPWRDCLAPAEMAQLPASGLIAVTQYIAEPGSGRRSGALLLLDVDGRLRGRYLFPNVALPDGTPVAVHPREVDVDPTGIVGAERVAVVFDTVIGEGMPNSRLGSFAVQELTVDSERGVIAPRSAAVATGQTLGARALSPETAQYDASGRLWVAQAVPGTLDAGPLVTYDAGALAACQDRAWATACPPDATVSGTAAYGIVRSLTPEPRSGTMLAATMAGALLVVRPGADGGPGAATAINLGLDALVDRTIRWIGPRKGAVDASRSVLWLPIQQLRAPGVCTGDPCSLDQWLMRIDLEKLLGLPRLTTPTDDAMHDGGSSGEVTAAPTAPTPPTPSTPALYVPVPGAPAGDSTPAATGVASSARRPKTPAHRSTRTSRRARRCQVRLRKRTIQFHVKSSRRTGTCTIKRKRGQ